MNHRDILHRFDALKSSGKLNFDNFKGFGSETEVRRLIRSGEFNQKAMVDAINGKGVFEKPTPAAPKPAKKDPEPPKKPAPKKSD